MSEEQNDSPAFRLRPRRAAPKSYYTVRLEYSANPAAFIRERPRNPKRKIFTQKTGSNSTRTAYNQGNAAIKPTVVSKEEREREERRLRLHRDISASITTDTKMSPFLQRLDLEDLQPNSLYEHDHISLRVRKIEQVFDGRFLLCSCQSIHSSPPHYNINVRLYNQYANSSLIIAGKIINIAKFRTGPVVSSNGESTRDSDREKVSSSGHHSSYNNGSTTAKPTTASHIAHGINVKDEQVEHHHPHHHHHQKSALKSPQTSTDLDRQTSSSSAINLVTLPFDVIVKYTDVAELRSTSSNSSTRGSSTAATSSGGSSSLSHGGSIRSPDERPLIPFINITDMIEQPTEPFVEMSPSSPPNSDANHHDHENVDAKKVKFTANLPV